MSHLLPMASPNQLAMASACAAAGAALLMPRPERSAAALLLLAASWMLLDYCTSSSRSRAPASAPAAANGDGQASAVILDAAAATLAERIAELTKKLPSSSAVLPPLRAPDSELAAMEARLQVAQSQAEAWRVTASDLAQLLNQLGVEPPSSTSGSQFASRKHSPSAVRPPQADELFKAPGERSPTQVRRRYAMPVEDIIDHNHHHQHSKRSASRRSSMSLSPDVALSTEMTMDMTSAPEDILPPSNMLPPSMPEPLPQLATESAAASSGTASECGEVAAEPASAAALAATPASAHGSSAAAAAAAAAAATPGGSGGTRPSPLSSRHRCHREPTPTPAISLTVAGTAALGRPTAGGGGGGGGGAEVDGLRWRALKCAVKLIKATAHEVELEVPADMRVRSVHKAETLVRLSWLSPPTTFLLLKKPGSSDITAAMSEMGGHLCSRAGAAAKLIVEPAVYHEMKGSELTLHTWVAAGFDKPEAEAVVDVSELSAMVDLIVCLGGDGTLLWASGLFQEVRVRGERVRGER